MQFQLPNQLSLLAARLPAFLPLSWLEGAQQRRTLNAVAVLSNNFLSGQVLADLAVAYYHTATRRALFDTASKKPLTGGVNIPSSNERVFHRLLLDNVNADATSRKISLSVH